METRITSAPRTIDTHIDGQIRDLKHAIALRPGSDDLVARLGERETMLPRMCTTAAGVGLAKFSGTRFGR